MKLKEISYIHAEGYPAAEMKHGPIALIDENMPVVVIATRKGNYHKVVSNILEIKARGGQIIAVVSEGDTEIEKLADHIIEIPNCDELIAPILANIPLQLLSYHIANKKGCNVESTKKSCKISYGGVRLWVGNCNPRTLLVTFSISITTTKLWDSNYSEYQKYLYNRIW